ncbi:MAG: hypothetical protein H6807_00695 [Planctomycetes bacterium]|nr:hypothetical protein [Planctomycetota bacterium]
MFLVFEDREILVFAVALVALVLFWRVRDLIGPARGLATLAILALVVALAATNVEEILPEPAAAAVNIVEHLAYLGHSVLLFLWIRQARRRSALR